MHQMTAARNLSNVKCAACPYILCAVKGIATAAMEVLLSIPPIDIVILGKTRMAGYIIHCAGFWNYHEARKNTKIGDILRDILDVVPEQM